MDQYNTAPLERLLDGGGTLYATNISLRWSELKLLTANC